MRRWLILALVPLASGAFAAPLEIAHRGASGYLPEHTLEATVLAHGLGAAYIEQDVVLSKDGVAVVLHDVHLDGVSDVKDKFPGRSRSDGKNYVIDFTLAELKSLTVRERFRPESGEPVHPTRYSASQPSFRIPTLEECFALIRGLNASTGREVGVYVEVKRPSWHLAEGQDAGAAVVAALAAYGYREKSDLCYVQCFELSETRRLREELGYRGRLVQLFGGDKAGADGTDYVRLRSPEGLRELVALGIDGVGPSLDSLASGENPGLRQVTTLVADAQAAGLEVHPYTARRDALPRWIADYPALIALLAEFGVEAYFTDFPGALR